MCIISDTRMFIKQDNLSGFKKFIDNRDNLTPLVLPLIRQHKHSFLKAVFSKGIINPDSTQVETLPGTLHYLQGLRLSDLVGLPLDVPVFADNDARVALAGEIVWGAAQGIENVVMLTLGMGVGGAVVALYP